MLYFFYCEYVANRFVSWVLDNWVGDFASHAKLLSLGFWAKQANDKYGVSIYGIERFFGNRVDVDQLGFGRDKPTVLGTGGLGNFCFA